MRIAHLSSVHSAHDTRILLKECTSLVEAGYEVFYIVPYTARNISHEVSILAVKVPKNRFERMLMTTWRIYRLAAGLKAEIYQFHDPELIPVGLLLRFRGAHVIYDVHEDLPRQILNKYWIPRWLRKVAAKGAELVEEVASKFLCGIVAATPAIAMRFPTDKTVVVQNFPIRGELINPNAEPYTIRPTWITYVGGISTIRGACEMISSMRLLPKELGARLKMAGSFDPPSLLKELQINSGWQYVDALGWLDRRNVADLLGCARMGLVLFHPVPNHTEAQPNKLFEYMAAGLPVIASNFPLWKEIIEGNYCGLTVDPLDPKEIAEAIEYLIRHPEEARTMGENGRRAVVEKYNWESEGEKLLRLYEELLKR